MNLSSTTRVADHATGMVKMHSWALRTQIDGFDSVRIFSRYTEASDEQTQATTVAPTPMAKPEAPVSPAFAPSFFGSCTSAVPAMSSSSAPHWWRPSERPSIATVSTAVVSVFSW